MSDPFGRDTPVLLRDLVEAYAMAADQRDADWFSSLWLPDATLAVYDGEERRTGIYEGADAMRGVTRALGRYVRTIHLVTTHRAVVDGDGTTAKGQTYCTAHHLTGSSSNGAECEDLVMTIRYDDEFGLDDDGAWRF